LSGKGKKNIEEDLPKYIMDYEVASYIRMALRKAKRSGATVDY